jgi:hypothetical protein
LDNKPSRTIDLRKYYSEDVVDTMQLWSNWGFKKFVKLEELVYCVKQSDVYVVRDEPV